MDVLGDIRKNDHEIQNRTCFICEKIFSGRSQLYRHLREVHNTSKKAPNKDPRNNFKCLEGCGEGCGVSFRTNRDLRAHLNDSHGFNITLKTIEFDNFKDFQKWFIELQETGAGFIKNRSPNPKKKFTYYACNRSGRQKYKPTEGKRRLKAGYRKINAGCTSFLKLAEMSGKYLITYCDFHYGHKMELEHLPLSYRSRAKIVDMLEKGAQIVKIKLDEGGSYIGLNNMQRWKILTSSDLKNLKYFTKKELKKLKTMPILRRRNMNVIEPDEESTADNESVEVITIISSKNDSEDAPGEEQLIYNSNNEIEQIHQEDVDAMESQDSEEPLADEHFGEEYGIDHDDSTDKCVEDVAPEEEQLIYNSNNEIHQFHQEEVNVMESQDSDELLADEHFEEEHGIDHDDSTDKSDENTDEDMYGQYVAETLKKIEPCKRVLAKGQIDRILQTFHCEKPTS